jgi:hypothetical protein
MPILFLLVSLSSIKTQTALCCSKTPATWWRMFAQSDACFRTLACSNVIHALTASMTYTSQRTCMLLPKTYRGVYVRILYTHAFTVSHLCMQVWSDLSMKVSECQRTLMIFHVCLVFDTVISDIYAYLYTYAHAHKYMPAYEIIHILLHAGLLVLSLNETWLWCNPWRGDLSMQICFDMIVIMFCCFIIHPGLESPS